MIPCQLAHYRIFLAVVDQRRKGRRYACRGKELDCKQARDHIIYVCCFARDTWKMIWSTCLLGLTILIFCGLVGGRYQPSWESLDTRPLPEWYDDVKFGLFPVWGVYSVPSFDSEWFWYRWRAGKQADIVQFMQQNYPPDFTYPDFAPKFKAELFDPDEWADILASSGAK